MTCEYTKELKSYINDLKKNLDSFPDSNEEECMDILTNFFSSLNKYLNDPKIQAWKSDALTMVETSTVDCNKFSILFINILTHYVNCLEDFKLFVFDDNLSLYLINYIKIKIIENNIADIIGIGTSFISHYNAIMNIWNKISNENRCEDLSQAILDAINVRTILILYGYYHYIKTIDEFIKTKGTAGIVLNELIEHIFSDINLEECAEAAKINCILPVPIKNIFKNYLIEQFNKVVLLINAEKNEMIRYVYEFNIDTKTPITENINKLLSETPSENTINELFKQILIIVRNYMSYEPIKYKKIDNYITIPQYVGNCWYISMITGMSYSDRSRKLLQKQFSTSIPNLPIEQNDETNTIPMNAANTLFTEFIKYIINTITSKKLIYSDELSDDCGHFINFKNNQTNYLDAIYADLLPKIEKQYPNIDDDIDQYISNMDSYIGSAMAYYYKIYLKTEYNKISKQPKKSLYGISTHEFIILAYLYNLFNVKTLYLYEMNKRANKKYRKSIFSIYSDENPDIIFIDNIKDKFLDKKYKMLKDYETPFLTYPNLEIIILNDNIYVLDYIIINDNEEGKCETLKCGHVISAITYNKQKYMYNSQFNINETLKHHIKCGDEEIRIPCPLFRQNWNIVDTIDFCVRKCYNKQLTDIASLPDQPYKDYYKLCYSTINSHTIQAYIKLGSLTDIGVSVDDCETVIKQKIEEYEATTELEAKSGGANKKVKIIINKKIINRVVFKNKYVKINNNNVDLSNFKYSKKYDVYYIKKSDLNIL